MIVIVINNNSNNNNIKLNKIINNKVKTRLSTTCDNFDSPTGPHHRPIVSQEPGHWSILTLIDVLLEKPCFNSFLLTAPITRVVASVWGG